MKKNILLITHSTRSTGGAEDDFERIMEYLLKDIDFSCTIIAPPGFRYKIYKERNINIFPYKESWFPIMTDKWYNYIKYFLIGIIQIIQLHKVIKNKKYNCAVINVSVLLLPSIYIYFKRIKSIVFIRETISSKKIRKVYFKYLKKISTYFIGVSKYNAEEFADNTNDGNIQILYSAIEPKEKHIIAEKEEIINIIGKYYFDLLNNNDNFKIFVNGTICERKNQLFALEIMHYIVNKKNIKNIIVFFAGDITGDNNYYKNLLNKINEFELNAKIIFLGSLPKNIIYYIYNKINLLLVTSLSEGMPLAIVEAFCYKIPVISSNVGGIHEVVKNDYNGYLIKNYSINEYGEKIINLKNDKQKYGILSKNAETSFQTYFNLNKNLNDLKQIINKL